MAPQAWQLAAASVTQRKPPADLRLVNAVDAARHLKIPALVVHDRRDREVAWEDGRAITGSWKGSRLLTTEGLGHRRILSDGGVLEAVLDFVDHPAASRAVAAREATASPLRRDSRKMIAV